MKYYKKKYVSPFTLVIQKISSLIELNLEKFVGIKFPFQNTVTLADFE